VRAAAVYNICCEPGSDLHGQLCGPHAKEVCAAAFAPVLDKLLYNTNTDRSHAKSNVQRRVARLVGQGAQRVLGALLEKHLDHSNVAALYGFVEGAVPANVVHFDGTTPHAKKRQAERDVASSGSKVQTRVSCIIHIAHEVSDTIGTGKLHYSKHDFGDATNGCSMETSATQAIRTAQNLIRYTLANWRQERRYHIDVAAHARAVKHCAVVAVEYEHELALRVVICRGEPSGLTGREHTAAVRSSCADVIHAKLLAAVAGKSPRG
jgi:hypothetical protein